MEKEDTLKFTNLIILLSKLFMTLEDRFLKQKLHSKILDFVSAFIEQRTKLSPTPTSHNINLDLKNSVNNLVDYLEYLIHISKENTTPLFLAQKNLLKFKLYILRKSKVKESARIPKNSMTSETPIAVDTSATVLRSSLIPKISRLALRPDSNKERIFNFIKKIPDVRTKDIMSEFNALSGRTVKRSLKELTEEGWLEKRSDGVAVYYLATK